MVANEFKKKYKMKILPLCVTVQQFVGYLRSCSQLLDFPAFTFIRILGEHSESESLRWPSKEQRFERSAVLY